MREKEVSCFNFWIHIIYRCITGTKRKMVLLNIVAENMLKSTQKRTNNVYKVPNNVPLNSNFTISLIFTQNYEKIYVY